MSGTMSKQVGKWCHIFATVWLHMHWYLHQRWGPVELSEQEHTY
jgi:hypothetical protein